MITVVSPEREAARDANTSFNSSREELPGARRAASYHAGMPDTPLLLGSSNPGKLREMRELLAGQPYRVLGPADLGLRDTPEETGATFMENAILKVRHYAERSGLLAVADD